MGFSSNGFGGGEGMNFSFRDSPPGSPRSPSTPATLRKLAAAEEESAHVPVHQLLCMCPRPAYVTDAYNAVKNSTLGALKPPILRIPTANT